ncbi:hypothetical protein HHK36_013574 [Tetracentron sinense]|uniref:Uncharacterized protein n=1 Tax=Tetracentron sinense TaxID=13715 RepID=A0A835DGV6_TETSI|nr:hypothetical protein HHK36_013574 [Tetracentron sinense]
MAITKESTPPPVIGKAGRYTVFLTPPAIPKPSETVSESPKIQSPKKVVLPPVQPPPQRFDKLSGVNPSSNSSVLGFFWNAVAKVQNAHSSLDECLADWLGLNHSKYQWALDDYYENKGMAFARIALLCEEFAYILMPCLFHASRNKCEEMKEVVEFKDKEERTPLGIFGNYDEIELYQNAIGIMEAALPDMELES